MLPVAADASVHRSFEKDGIPGASAETQSPSTTAALSRVFEDHNRALHSFLMMRTRNEQEAREVAQEAYVRVLQLNTPGAVSFLRAYLFKTAANIAVDRERQRATRARLDRLDAGEDLVDRLSPDRNLMAREELDLLEKALQELPPRYRQAFILHRFDERSTSEIARELGIEARMVRNYISRTVLYCRLRLKGFMPSEAKAQVMP